MKVVIMKLTMVEEFIFHFIEILAKFEIHTHTKNKTKQIRRDQIKDDAIEIVV